MTAQQFAEIIRALAPRLPQQVVTLNSGYRVETPDRSFALIRSAEQVLCECVSFRWGGACVHAEAVKRHEQEEKAQDATRAVPQPVPERNRLHGFTRAPLPAQGAFRGLR